MLGRMLRHAREHRAADLVYEGPDSFSSSDAVSLFGPGQQNGVWASEERILGLPAVYRAMNLLAGVAQMLPIRARKYADHSIVPGNQVQTRFLEDPTGSWLYTAGEWRAWEMRCRLVVGNSFFLKVGMTASNPYPSRLIPIHPRRVSVAGVYKHGVQTDTLYVINNTNQDTFGSWEEIMEANLPTMDRRNIFHVPGPSFNGVYGISPIDAARRSLSGEVVAEDAASSFYKSGSLMSGFLYTDRTLKEGQAAQMKQRWQEKVAGAANAYEVAVLDGGVKFEPMTISPQDAQWIESRKFNLEQIARVFGVPPFMLMMSIAGQSFGTGLDAQLTALQIFTFNEWLNPLENRLTMECLPGTMYAQFNRKQLERADMKSLHGAYAIARQNGYMAIDEIREDLDLPIIGSEDSGNPMLEPPKGAGAADQPGGNEGLQGGGEESSPDVVA